MKKRKRYPKKDFSSEIIYSAYKLFLSKSGISEDDAYTYFSTEKDDVTVECDNSSEFFVKIGGASDFHLNISKDAYQFGVTKYTETFFVDVKFPSESDIDEILRIFDGSIKTPDDHLEKTLEEHWSKNKKLAIIGIGVTIGLFIIGIIVTNFGIIP